MMTGLDAHLFKLGPATNTKIKGVYRSTIACLSTNNYKNKKMYKL